MRVTGWIIEISPRLAFRVHPNDNDFRAGRDLHQIDERLPVRRELGRERREQQIPDIRLGGGLGCGQPGRIRK